MSANGEGGQERRAYSSPLRDEQARRTRELIVEALVEQVCETGRSDFSMNEVAKRAGVSVRTVYRHFPTRDDLVNAINEHLMLSDGQPGVPESPEGMADHVGGLFRWFESNAALVEASHLTGLGREVRAHGRRHRTEVARQLTEDWSKWMTEEERRKVFAVFRTMFGSFTWLTMRNELGLSTEEAIEATSWVVRLVIEDLQRRNATRNNEDAGE